MKKNKAVWLILLAAVVLLAAAIIILLNADGKNGDTSASPSSAVEESGGAHLGSLPISSVLPDNPDAPDSSQASANAEDTKVSLTEVQKDKEIYEHWLTAAALTGISLTYPDFDNAAYYLSGETSLAARQDSKGIYVAFTSGGEDYCLYAAPLREERTAAGTKDLYSELIGFASFDIVQSIPEQYEQTKIDSINDIIARSGRVMLYEH